MKVTATDLADVKIVEPEVFGDARGFFFEAWNARAFAAAGLPTGFVQDNHSRSMRGVLRGLHYQVEQAQGKLVRVARGAVYDVAVDLRRSSPTFRHWVGVELSEANRRMLWIPPGFGHGFLALEDDSELLYKCTDFHAPEHERALLWSDPAIDIQWPLPNGAPLLSGRDAAAPMLAAADTFP